MGDRWDKLMGGALKNEIMVYKMREGTAHEADT